MNQNAIFTTATTTFQSSTLFSFLLIRFFFYIPFARLPPLLCYWCCSKSCLRNIDWKPRISLCQLVTSLFLSFVRFNMDLYIKCYSIAFVRACSNPLDKMVDTLWLRNTATQQQQNVRWPVIILCSRRFEFAMHLWFYQNKLEAKRKKNGLPIRLISYRNPPREDITATTNVSPTAFALFRSYFTYKRYCFSFIYIIFFLVIHGDYMWLTSNTGAMYDTV